ncbi:MAG: hypothetical protein HWD59_09785 [Coxiellaceae bacterium]|nr:MAG: hypothetical protein HWD59_09785 [Coxiellaceae bacterium]
MEAITPDIARKIGEIKTVDIECYPDTLQMILENCQRTEDITVNLLLDQKLAKLNFYSMKKMPRLKRIKFSTTSINASGLNASYPTFNIRGSSTKLKA